jgi:hypothetical protein
MRLRVVRVTQQIAEFLWLRKDPHKAPQAV